MFLRCNYDKPEKPRISRTFGYPARFFVLFQTEKSSREDGGHELIAGHWRKHACELAGLTTMPVIVRDIDRDAAMIIMVDSNLQRENILPSERTKAHKMKLEAIPPQGWQTRKKRKRKSP